MLLDKEGYYFGIILDSGFGESSGGFPQESLMLQAQQVYDIDSEAWVPVDPAGGTDITYYGVLFGGNDKETLNCKQLKKVTGWDGADFSVLSELVLTNKTIQFRAEFRKWEEKTSLQVTWIDPEGASPFRSVPKLDKEGVAALQSRYAGVLAATRAPVTPASAPVTPASAPVTPASAPPADKPKRTRRTKVQIEADEAAAKAKIEITAQKNVTETSESLVEERQSLTTKPAGRPQMPAAARPGTAAVGKCTADEAWDACVGAKKADVPDDQLIDAWTKATLKHSPGNVEANATDETWFLVREDIIAQTGQV